MLKQLALAAMVGLFAAAAHAEDAAPADAVKKVVKQAKKPAKDITGSVGTPARVAIPYQPEGGLVNWYAERGNVRYPGDDRLVYCHGYNCLYRKSIDMSDADHAQLAAIFAGHAKSAEDERVGIDLAVQWWEKRAAPLLSGPLDIRGSDYAHSGQQGQTDCLDEATNSTTILIYLQRQGLLRYHHVVRPTSRGGILAGYVHATAVFTDMETKKDWVVDSWMRDSGDPNDVMTLDEWSSHL